MEVSAILQARLFAYALVLGLAFGVLDHLFRLTAAFLQMDTRCRTGSLLLDGWSHTGLFFLDVTFFAVCAAVSCAFFFLFGDGRPRGFAVCGMLFSFWLYRVSIGRLCVSAAKRGGRAILRLLGKAVHFCAAPLRQGIKRCKNAAKPIVSAAKAKYNKRKTTRKKEDRRTAVLRNGGVRKGEQNEIQKQTDLTRL